MLFTNIYGFYFLCLCLGFNKMFHGFSFHPFIFKRILLFLDCLLLFFQLQALFSSIAAGVKINLRDFNVFSAQNQENKVVFSQHFFFISKQLAPVRQQYQLFSFQNVLFFCAASFPNRVPKFDFKGHCLRMYYFIKNRFYLKQLIF